MTSDTGWPDRPGVPLTPERDGWHWVGNVTREWLAQFQMWQDRHGYCVMPATWAVLPYGGPCLTPAEVAAREAAAFKRGAEATREAAMRASRDCWTLNPSTNGYQVAEAIRALPIPEDKP